MLITGLQGSPRKKGNTDFLLSTFLQEAENHGAKTHIVQVGRMDIAGCRGCAFCEKNGFCIIEDDMSREIYPLFRKSEIIVAATPMFFYNAPAQLKALIDRSQALWSRKYKFNLTDPGRKTRRGFLLALGATKGKNLFDGVRLTAKYFFDAAGAVFEGSLTYRQIENPGDMEKHPDLIKDVKTKISELVSPFSNRKKILFACRENACRSQMAAAFAQTLAGDKIEVLCGGSNPANKINPEMAAVMEEKGIDLAYRAPESIDLAVAGVKPDVIISMGCGEECRLVPGSDRAEIKEWDLPDPAGQSIDFMRNIRDEIKKRVTNLVAGLPLI